MNVFNNIKDLSKELKVEEWKCERDLQKFIGHDYAIIEGTEIKVAIKDNEFNYIVLDLESNDDCKQYFMEYEQYYYTWKVYVDDLEGWQECKVLNIENTRLGINRATVLCSSGTQLNRLVKFALDEDEIKPDRCIYFIEK
ncbi:unknown [Clostridium sp. CAG:221]|uniref:hypothetical protein n=1 Tax=Clostridium sp. CAG:221 TaxID=1262780 RepID=UPI00033B8245|nr:hypothetical protein [Clostridium sp. CAG:221]CDB14701.1 unknown [Clostridium sp. CAG:221]